MSSKSKKSTMNFATAVFYKLLVIVVGLIIPKLFITSYGSEINGLQTSVKQFFTYLALVESGVGASTLQSLYKPVAINDHNKTNSYLSAASAYYNKIGILYFVVLTVLAGVYCLGVPISTINAFQVALYIMVSGALTGVNFFYLAKLKLLISAEGDQYIVSTITMVTYLVSSVTKITLIYLGFNIILIEAVFLVINLASTFVYYLVAKYKYPWLSFREKPDYSCVEQKWSVMVHRIASIIFQNVDVVLLTFFCSLEVVSIYSMYKMVINMVTSIVSEIGNSMNFVFGHKFNSESENDRESYCRLIDTFNVYYSCISFAFYTVTYILILPFLSFYTDGMDINYIYHGMPILYIMMEFLMVGREAMMRTIEVAGHFRRTQWRTVAEAIINLVVSIVLIIVLKFYFGDIGGIYGALSGTIVALLYRTIDINVYANKNILNRSVLKTFSVMLVNGCIFIVVMLLVNYLSITVDDFMGFLVYACCITPVILVVFLVVHSLINVKEFKYVLMFLKNKFKSKGRKL